LEKYKARNGKRYFIDYIEHTLNLDFILSYSVIEVPKGETVFITTYKINLVTFAKLGKKQDDKQFKNLLTELGFKSIKRKIDENNFSKEEIIWEHANLLNLGQEVYSSKDLFLRDQQVQTDILACLVSKDGKAVSKELVEYVWCDGKTLFTQLNLLHDQGFIISPQTPQFDENLLNTGIDDAIDFNTVVLTPEGKKKFDKMMMDDTPMINHRLKPAKKWVPPPVASNKTVFFAYRFYEKTLIDQVEDALIEAGFTCTKGRVTTLEDITEDILNKIKGSEFFLALITANKEFKDDTWSTSSGILMAIGAALGFKNRIVILAEDLVDKTEYMGKMHSHNQYEIFFDKEQNFSLKLQNIIEIIQSS